VQEIRSYGSVGERGGNKPLYPEPVCRRFVCHPMFHCWIKYENILKAGYYLIYLCHSAFSRSDLFCSTNTAILIREFNNNVISL